MSERVRSVAGSSAMLVGCLVAKRLSALEGVTLRTGSSDTGLMIRMAGAEASFALSSAISSNNSHCAHCISIKVGVN